ncbi:MAG: hypothetical protein Q8S84_05370 [bacterium]|nr:hypothetical protein [bacterium]
MKYNHGYFFDCIFLSSSFISIHPHVAFASFQLLQFCNSNIISVFCSDNSKNLTNLLGVFSISNTNFKLRLSSIYFSNNSSSNHNLFKYSHIAFETL